MKRRAQGLRSNRRRWREAPLNALAAKRDKRGGEGEKEKRAEGALNGLHGSSEGSAEAD